MLLRAGIAYVLLNQDAVRVTKFDWTLFVNVLRYVSFLGFGIIICAAAARVPIQW